MDAEAETFDNGDDILSQRLEGSTKLQYKRKIIHFETWVTHFHPDLINEELETEEGDVGVDYEHVTPEIIKKFLSHISKKRNFKAETPETPYVYITPQKLQSVQHVNGYRSALVDKFRSKGIQLDFDRQTMFKGMMTGYQRIIQKKKQNGEMDMHEGKYPLSFSGYRFLAKKALEQTTDFPLAIFAHIFLLLCWNLLARCVSVSSIMYQHISWEEDSMVIVFPTTKSDKVGKNSAPIHVFANRKHPEICPILWFAVFIWCSGFRRAGSTATVFGTPKDTQKRFSTWLHSVLGSSENDLLIMGIIILEIGTHSFRKGVANFLSGLVGGPSAIAIYLRAGWSLGPVTSRYIMEGQGNDQLCGRAASGLSLTDIDFADLPPHFDLSKGAVISIAQWEEILPGYSTYYPQSFRQVLPFLLASIVHHQDYLKEVLHPSHPFFQSRLWTSGIVSTLSEKVFTGNGKNPVTLMTATGIPPHLLLAKELATTRGEIEKMRETIIQKLQEVPEQVKACMLENFQVDGTVPITVSQVQTMMSDMQERLVAAILDQGEQQRAALQEVSTSLAPAGLPSLQFLTYTWGGGIHSVPESFRFPK